MPTKAELSYVDQVGRYYSRQYGLQPMTGRVAGWLLICDPPAQTAADIAEALQASRSAVGAALTSHETWGFIRRIRVPGERAERILVNPYTGEESLESPAEYGGILALARAGLDLLADEPLERRGRLLGMEAFAQFLLERMPSIADEWRARRAALEADGRLPREDA